MSEQKKAADAYKAGAAQRDPQSVQKAQATASGNAGAAASAKAGGRR